MADKYSGRLTICVGDGYCYSYMVCAFIKRQCDVVGQSIRTGLRRPKFRLLFSHGNSASSNGKPFLDYQTLWKEGLLYISNDVMAYNSIQYMHAICISETAILFKEKSLLCRSYLILLRVCLLRNLTSASKRVNNSSSLFTCSSMFGIPAKGS